MLELSTFTLVLNGNIRYENVEVWQHFWSLHSYPNLTAMIHERNSIRWRVLLLELPGLLDKALRLLHSVRDTRSQSKQPVETLDRSKKTKYNLIKATIPNR